MTEWAIDLGTSNTGVARWDTEADRPRLLELPTICHRPGRSNPMEAPRLVRSATHCLSPEGFWDKMGRSRFGLRNTFWGQHALIGRPALDKNEGWQAPNFAPNFKSWLGLDPHRTLAKLGGQSVSAREISRLFLRELFRQVKLTTGSRIHDLVITTPVEAFESYRKELIDATAALGVKRLRFIDEPVAAAIGYGLSAGHQRLVLVVDFGGGTLDLALVELSARETETGGCRVLAKEGRPVGGNTIDGWLLQHFTQALEIDLQGPDAALWHRLMLSEARRVKEAVHFESKATFSVTPPAEARGLAAQLQDARRFLKVSRADVVEILKANALYDVLDDCIDGIHEQARRLSIDPDAIEDVLMVGGSTLLPDVYSVFEARYGRGRVRAWQPFEAVAYGASAFAAGRFNQSDFIVHDYALVTYDPKTHDPVHTIIVPRGERFPTAPDFWRKQLVPTCALGEPEAIFKLVIAELAGGDAGQRKFAWNKEGQLRKLGGADDSADTLIVVPLNEANPTLGHLDPPHAPGDGAARLDISFGIDANRWLIATVTDLKTRKQLMVQEPVIRLM